MISRRKLIQAAMLMAATPAMTAHAGATSAPARWRMPDEAEPHQRTWMAFGASEAIWGHKLLPEVRRNLATIARSVVPHEPVSMLVRPAEEALARELVGTEVELIPHPLDDLWMRDTAAVFVVDDAGGKAAIDFNFNGWGQKQDFGQDAEVARFVAARAGVEPIDTSLILEGGGIEVDGHGTAIVSESCVLIDNRNPGLTKNACEAALKTLLGLDKIIWLSGIRGRDITDGHTDFYARFAGPGMVVAGYDPDPQSYDHAVTRRHLEILEAATDARGKSLEVIALDAPRRIRQRYETPEFAAGYVGFYVCNGAVIAQTFGDRDADAAAQKALQRAFPEREIVPIAIDGIAAGGGSIHCATMQEPAV